MKGAIRRLASGETVLAVRVNRRTAYVIYQQRALKWGLIYLGADWEDRLPPMIIPADPEDGRLEPIEVYGFVDNPELLALYKRFRAWMDGDKSIQI